MARLNLAVGASLRRGGDQLFRCLQRLVAGGPNYASYPARAASSLASSAAASLAAVLAHGAAAMLESESPMHVAPPTADAVAADASTRRRRIAIAFGAMEAAGLGTAGCWASSQQQQHNTTSWSLSSSNEYD